MFIETYILRILAAIQEYKTFSRVAEELGSSQPAVTRAMKKLEDELNVTLFERTKNRATLNENGVFAAEYAKKILLLQEEMIEKTREKALEKRELKIGSVAIMPALKAREEAKKIYPKIKITHTIDDDEEKLLQGLKDEVYDIVILLNKADKEKYYSQKYFGEKLSVLLSKSHRLAKRKSVSLKDLAGETFVMYDDIGFWDKVKREKIPNAKFIRVERKDENDPIKQIINASDMISFISDQTTHFVVPENRVAVPLSDKEMNVTFYAVCKKEILPHWLPLFDSLSE